MVYGADNSMFAYNIDGSKHILNANKTWTSTKQDGQRVITDLSAQVLETLTSTRATREYHPALASLLISREDFVNIKMEGILPSENNEEPATLRPSLCRADFGDGTSIESSYETDGALSRITVDQSTYGKLVFHNDGISCDLIFEDGIIIEKRTRPSGGVEFAVKMVIRIRPI